MKITLKNRYTDKVIIEGEYESIKDLLEKNRGADLNVADLNGADLRRVDLHGADLRGANLRRAKIEMTQQIDIIKALGIIVEDLTPPPDRV